MKLRFYITIGVLFIFAGALLSSDYIIQLIKSAFAQSAPQPIGIEAKVDAASEQKSAALPSHIDVPAADISLDIEPGYYNYSKNTWTVSNEKANFATITSAPNTKSGNTYIYGHNKPDIFAKLNDLTVGDEAMVTNSEGKIFEYKLVSERDISPDDLSFLKYNGKPILTLQTCSGFWDQYRRLFVFDLESEI